jgi:RP/EB family microtubule-associated protein
MMDGAYFTSRKEILDFLNNLLDLNLTKIEQTASGAVACQLTEYLFPNSIPMSRVDWGAKASHEYVANYKLLQSAFNKNKIRKHVDVDKLIRGKYQDNLEFCQWLKAFFDQTSPMMSRGRDGYDPVAVRAKGKGGKNVERSKGGGGRANSMGTARTFSSREMTGSTAVKAPGDVGPTKIVAATSRTTRPPSSSSSSTASRKENIANTSSTGSTLPSKPRKQPSISEDGSAISILKEENRQLKSENAELQSKCADFEENIAELELSLQTVESERNFYFEKLRGIEIMLQVFKEKEESSEDIDLGMEARKVIERAFKVMYATEEDNVEVDDEGNVSFATAMQNDTHAISPH